VNVPQKNAKAIRRESIFFRDRTSNDSSCAPNGKEIKAKPRDTPICVVVCHRGKKASFLSASRFQTIMPFLHSFYISCCHFELHSNQWHFGTCDPDHLGFQPSGNDTTTSGWWWEMLLKNKTHCQVAASTTHPNPDTQCIVYLPTFG